MRIRGKGRAGSSEIGLKHRLDFAVEIRSQPIPVCGRPACPTHEADSLRIQSRHDFFIEKAILLRYQFVALLTDCPEQLPWRQHVRPRWGGRELFPLLQTADADLEKFIEISRDNAEEFEPLEQRHAPIFSLMQHPPAELQRAEFPVDVVIGEFEIVIVHDSEDLARRQPTIAAQNGSTVARFTLVISQAGYRYTPPSESCPRALVTPYRFEGKPSSRCRAKAAASARSRADVAPLG